MNDNKNIGLLGVPVQVGAGMRGCIMGPHAMRCMHIRSSLEDLGHNVVDYGDVKRQELKKVENFFDVKKPDEIAAWTEATFLKATEVFEDNKLPIFMGGDHSIAMGTIGAAAKYADSLGKPLKVIWIDAHPDYNTMQSSPSGNMHGMPVAALCGEKDLTFLYESLDQKILKPSDFYMFGIRSVDQEEHDMIMKRGINIYDMQTIDRQSLYTIMADVLKEIKDSGAMLHVSFDVDGLDPDIAPAVGTTVPGGLTYREAHTIMEMISESNMCTSVDIVELNPMLDEKAKTARLMVDLISSLFGKRIIYRKGSRYLK